ncbi:ABC transporter substrate-binding protein [Halorussus halophilus]|uniref:ABC transporter substrate-binding protein n=1 Tax=Halorussus halophilus TaxID=2650975 RepID=UPI0013018B11|nr:ABC transporter substrate-binding protein [Halorussus halophilus]
MSRGSDSNSTRRQFIVGSAAVSSALLAGCTGGDGSDEGTTTEGTTAASGTTSGDGTTESEGSETTESASGSYSVNMAPVGEVTFESVPKKWLVYEAGYADMGVALGQADGLQAVGYPPRFHTKYYDELPGVSVDKESMKPLYDGGIDKEIFFELNCGVHLIDPKWLTNNSAFGLEQNDLDQIEERVAPFVGNTIFRRTDSWHDYEYYSMYEAFEKVAEVFQQKPRYDAFKKLHDSFISDVQSKLPEKGPEAALVFAAKDEPGEFTPYRLSGKGTNKKQFRDLRVQDAFEGSDVQPRSTSSSGKIDYETLLEIDPEAILIRGHETKTAKEFENTILSYMKDHSAASQLTAVQNGQVFRGGPIYEGPIHNLFLTERFAKAFFPDTYSGKLFDRQKVADVVNGDF